MAKLQRNQLCICGSGKKYKRCCLPQDTQIMPAQVIDRDWQKIRQTEGTLIDQHLLPYAQEYFPGAFQEAWQYLLSLTEDCSEEMSAMLQNAFFTPWFLFHWELYLDPLEITTIGKDYLATYSQHLSHYERQFLTTINHSYYSFYIVEDTIPYKSVQLRDLLLRSTHTVKEYSGSLFLHQGSIVFARLVTIGEQSIFVGMAPYVIPAEYLTEILYLRDALVEQAIEEQEGEEDVAGAEDEEGEGEISPAILAAETEWLLSEYIYMLSETYGVSYREELHNSAGELLKLFQVQFALSCTAQEAATRLAPLRLHTRTSEEQDAAGVDTISFPWLAQDEDSPSSTMRTLLGLVQIAGNTLTIEVNSEERAKMVQELVASYLQEEAVFQMCILQEETIPSPTEPTANAHSRRQHELALLIGEPEAQPMMETLAEHYWQEWLDLTLPALKGESPKQAAASHQGRDRLEAFFSNFAKMRHHPILSMPIEKLRKALRL